MASTRGVMDHETIAAMATPMGTSGIGIIRVSGRQAVSSVQPLFAIDDQAGTQKEFILGDLPSHYLRHGFIFDPSRKQLVDEVMVVVMRAPRSYTREDVVEIQSHSGHVIMSTILNLVLDQGVRLAEPGEFTKRAFLNGRIDLSQAEAVVDVISARSDTALQLATTHLTGQLRAAVDGLVGKLDSIQMELEACIEFPEEVGDRPDLARIEATLRTEVQTPIDTLLDQYRQGHVLRDGIQLGIVGRPNVGKSSLLNCILQKDKAIVTPIPGTTRDPIEDQTCIGGVPVLITDTAGLRPSADPIEIVGIEKTQQSIAASDIILFVVDGSRPFGAEDWAVYELVKKHGYILCINKTDLIAGTDVTIPPEIYADSPAVRLSAKTGAGIDALKKTIKNRCLDDVKIEPGRSIVPNQRQKVALQKAGQALSLALTAICEGVTEELIISDLNAVRAALNQIVGGQMGDDILDAIFSKFCIGK